MNPFDLIPWAIASGISLLILAVPVALFVGAVSVGRRL